jgi:hypothetical protein
MELLPVKETWQELPEQQRWGLLVEPYCRLQEVRW